MTLNADFTQPVLIHSEQEPWRPSPMPGVERRMLDRIGDEVARATSIVRYAPGSHFSPHTHGGGEEFIVLEGVFQDENGDYPAGTYVRNPPGSKHTPGAADGCTIFVKLWQFDPDDRQQFRKDMAAELGPPSNGIAWADLHSDAREIVRFGRLAAGAEVAVDAPGGSEILVLEGALTWQGEPLSKGAWLRLPNGAPFEATSGETGADIWIKTGHLIHAKAPSA